MNCKAFHSACKASCCSFVPFDRTFFMQRFDKISRPVKELLDFGGGDVLPVTESGSCPFLNADYSCNIYNERPFVCRKYGDETDLMMTCAHQTKNGVARPKKEREKIERKQETAVKERLEG